MRKFLFYTYVAFRLIVLFAMSETFNPIFPPLECKLPVTRSEGSLLSKGRIGCEYQFISIDLISC